MPIVHTPVVPSFFLYGEPPRDIGDRFLHLEDLADRSRPGGWRIRPHAHANLNHVFLILAGAGEMRTERGRFFCTAPGLLLVPARLIHAFDWEPETSGRVLTISDAYAEELFARETGFRDLFTNPAQLALARGGDEEAALAACLVRLARELAWAAPGHAAAVEAHLLAFLVDVFRLTRGDRDASTAPPGPQAELVARFRHLIEADFRAGKPLDTYAGRLNVTLSRLRSACLKIARQPPAKLLQDRLALEAKRLLLYSNMNVTDVAYSLGFEDPAYFSRFFTKATRESPRAFRRRHRS